MTLNPFGLLATRRPPVQPLAAGLGNVRRLHGEFSDDVLASEVGLIVASAMALADEKAVA